MNKNLSFILIFALSVTFFGASFISPVRVYATAGAVTPATAETPSAKYSSGTLDAAYYSCAGNGDLLYRLAKDDSDNTGRDAVYRGSSGILGVSGSVAGINDSFGFIKGASNSTLWMFNGNVNGGTGGVAAMFSHISRVAQILLSSPAQFPFYLAFDLAHADAEKNADGSKKSGGADLGAPKYFNVVSVAGHADNVHNGAVNNNRRVRITSWNIKISDDPSQFISATGFNGNTAFQNAWKPIYKSAPYTYTSGQPGSFAAPGADTGEIL